MASLATPQKGAGQGARFLVRRYEGIYEVITASWGTQTSQKVTHELIPGEGCGTTLRDITGL